MERTRIMEQTARGPAPSEAEAGLPWGPSCGTPRSIPAPLGSS